MKTVMKKTGKGQTLVEVIVAVGVIGLVLTGIVLAASSGLKTSRVARERFEARRLASSKLEEVRNERNTDPASFFAESKAGSSFEEGPETIEGNLASYERTVSYDYTADGDEVEVTVEVEWGSDPTFSVSETTILTQWQ